MKQRNIKNGNKNDHWETPQYIFDYLNKKHFKGKDFFDPCPLHAKFDGLSINWKQNNFINPPYNGKDKEEFIKKAYYESQKGKKCILLIPANTDTKIFHKFIIKGKVEFIKGRVKFKGYNTKGEYVTNKTGQTGSMIVIFEKGQKPSMKAINLDKYKGE